jgi:seryl-tRNA synthetase
MLQVNVLRQKPDWAKERLAFKNFKQPELVDEIIALDDERKKLQAEFDNTQASINAASKEIGKLMGQGRKDEAEEQKATVANLKSSVNELNEKMSATEKLLQEK